MILLCHTHKHRDVTRPLAGSWTTVGGEKGQLDLPGWHPLRLIVLDDVIHRITHAQLLDAIRFFSLVEGTHVVY